MLISIVISTVQLATDNPLLDQDAKSYIALIALDKATSIFFMLEAIAKIIAFGLWHCGSTSYLRSNWNILDLVIVSVSFLSFGLPNTNLNLIKVVRLMKLLRPLRAISRNQGLMITVKALGVAYTGIINVIIVIMLFVFILSVIGINYFKGIYYECLVGPFAQ
jgi:voltage-dependent calcium channel L type alpha-1C